MSDAERERLVAENEELRAKSAALGAEVEHLTRLVADLKARLDKSSKNSSLPPSSDSPRDRAEAKERRKDELARSRVKQPGSSGQNLSMRPHPDVIVEHEPTNCSSCGEDLAAAAIEGIERRQVFDTPDPMLISTEHRSIA